MAMNALAVINGHEGRESSIIHIENQVPGEGEVLVKVHAAALGFTDYLLATGKYHHKPDLPFVLGGEAAGVVAGLGPGVDESWYGARVIVTPDEVVCGLARREVVSKTDNLLRIPSEMPMEEASALFIGYHTAHLAIFRRGRLQEGETLVVGGALGGVGSAAVQLGLAAGARVVGVASGAKRVAMLKDIVGDANAIDRTAGDLTASLRDVVGDAGVDVALDVVGGPFFDAVRRCMAVEGRLVVAGFASGVIPEYRVNHALIKNYDVIGFRTWPVRQRKEVREDVHCHLIRLYLEGAIQPLVEIVTLENAPAALDSIGQGKAKGRVVVRFRSENAEA